MYLFLSSDNSIEVFLTDFHNLSRSKRFRITMENKNGKNKKIIKCSYLSFIFIFCLLFFIFCLYLFFVDVSLDFIFRFNKIL